jgi:hypothetical protein
MLTIGLNVKKKLLSHFFKIAFILGFLFAFSTSEAQIAVWTYDPLVGTTAAPTPNTGTGTSSVVNPIPAELITTGTFAGTSTACAGGAGNAWAFTAFNPGSVNESNGAQFNVSTAGKQNVIFTWDQQCSDASANTLRVMYTTDGSTWLPFTMTNPGNTTICNGAVNLNGCFEFDNGSVYRRISVDFSAITAVNNNANFGVRLLASYYRSTTEFRRCDTPSSVASNGGTWRFDNVTVSGTAIAAPTAISMSAAATTICNGATTNLSVTFTGGTGPFTLTYNDSVLGDTVINNYVSGTAIPVTPNTSRTYSITSLQHAVGTDTSSPSPVAITVTSLPVIGTATAASTCFGATTTQLTYTGVSGAPVPNRYSITWNPVPANSFAAVPISTTLTGSPLTIAVPAGTPAGTYTGYFTVKNNGATTCPSNPKTFTITVNSPTVIVTPPSSSAQTYCTGETGTPLSVSATGASLSYQWRYDANSAVGGSSAAVGTTNSTTFTPTVTGYYFVRVSSASCTQLDSGYTGLITVFAGTVAGSVTGAQTICSGQTPSTSFVLSGNTGNVVKWERADDIGFTSGLANIGSTATTLTGASLVALSGPITQTTYIRAYVQNSSCSILTTTPIQVLVKSTTWTNVPPPAHWSNGAPDSSTTAIFDMDYSNGNVAACSVQVNSGSVIFNAGEVLTCDNALTVSAGATLTFENTASLMQASATSINANSGNIIYKRASQPVRKFDYTYWSSPVATQSLVQSPTGLFLSTLGVPLPMQSDKYYWFKTNGTDYNWAPPASSTMDLGMGYIIRAPLSNDPYVGSVITATFSGKPNNGDVAVNIVKTGANDLNCIGNPYPSAIIANSFVSQNALAFTSVPGGVLGTTFYFWTHNTPMTNNAYTFSDYVLYNSTGATGAAVPAVGLVAPTGYIGAGQSFMIRGIVEGTSVATFKNSMRSTNNTQFYRTNNHSSTESDSDKHRIWLDLSNDDGAFKQILVGYLPNASNGYDNGFDGEAIEAGNPVNIYSLVGNKKLTIQGKSLPFDANDEVPLGFLSASAGSFTVGLSNFDGVFADESVKIFLEDKLQNIMHDLRQSPYTFLTNPGTFDTRFVLRYSSNLGTMHPVLDGNAVLAIKSKDAIVVNSGSAIMKNVKIFDVSGRLLWENNNVHANQVSFTTGFSHEVLMVQVTSESNETVTKKIVN